MRFLWAQAGTMERMGGRFGVFTSPSHGGVVQGIKEGRAFAVDNECFTQGFREVKFFGFLRKLEPYRENNLFVTVPDVVGDAVATRDMWDKWSRDSRFDGWRLAFVAQDGQENYKIPDGAGALFIGGSTYWKESHHAMKVIQEAQRRGLLVHIGRINWKRRFFLLRGIVGSEKFTCDGTRHKYEDSEKTERAWVDYMGEVNYQLRLI